MSSYSHIQRAANKLKSLLKEDENVLLGHEFHHHKGKMIETYKIVDVPAHKIHTSTSLTEVIDKFIEARGEKIK